MNGSDGTPNGSNGGARAGRRRRVVLSSLLISCLAASAARAEEAAATAGAQGTSSEQVEYLFGLEEELGDLTVTAASKQAEPLREAPVPVTIITREMIRSIGARSLKDVLITFVPGITAAEDHNEMNVSARGVYASSQQKILILLDGHRLNSRAYSMANPDFSISLDKIKQIEVLRGPGSSLYGNVALMATINIVTLDGKDVDGAAVRVGAGDYGQRTAGLVVGKHFEKRHDLLLWGSFYSAKGQRIPISADQDYASSPRDGYAIVGGVRDPGSYDVGAKYRLGHFSLLGSSRMGRLVEPFSGSGMTGEVYDYDAFRSFGDTGPGLSSQSNHLEVRYARPLPSGLDVEVAGTYDTNELTAFVVSNPGAGGGAYLSWVEDSIGAIAQGRYHYDFGKAGKGNLTFGAQVDHMQLLDSNLGVAANWDWAKFGDTASKQVLERGSETIYSGFAQLKHHVVESVILNLGLRYDNKDRHQGPNVVDLSPRLALIYSPSDKVDVKASYASSFVDAPYWYRYNSLPSYRGAATLTPEHLQSLQLTPTVTWGRFKNTLNLFYNHLYDFVYRNNNAAPTEPIYQNAGVLKSVGVENEFEFTQKALRARLNLTYQRALESQGYDARGPQIFNVPSFTGNLILDANPLYALYQKSWVNLTLRYASAQLSPINVVFRDATGNPIRSYVEPDHREPQRMIVDAGIRVDDVYFPGFSVDLSVHNLLDTRYSQGGAVVHPYPQEGRWFLMNLGYHFSPEL